MTGMTIGKLRSALSVYDQKLEVRFKSVGPGGFWPCRTKEWLVVATEHDLASMRQLDNTPSRYLQIYLHEPETGT